jgi:hypothetical protein
MTQQTKDKPEVRVKPHSYQPSKAELNEPVKIDATPSALARAVLRPVRIVEERDD